MKRRPARAKLITVLLETLMAILHSLNHRWSITSSNWRAASACGTCLWWPCRPRRELIPHGAMVKACRRIDWRGQGRSVHPEPLQPACHGEITWPSERTLRMSDPRGMMRLYGLCKTGNLGALACRGDPRSSRCRRLWPRWGKLRLLPSFRRSSWLFFQRGGPPVRTCYAWV